MRIRLHFDPSRLFVVGAGARRSARQPDFAVVRAASLSVLAGQPVAVRTRTSDLWLSWAWCHGPHGVRITILATQAGQADVIIDLSGEEVSPTAQRVLRPLFNGVPSEIGIMAALANDQDLLVELHDTARPSNPWTARPASQDREVFSASLDAALSCATALILKALHHEDGSLDVDDVSPARLSLSRESKLVRR